MMRAMRQQHPAHNNQAKAARRLQTLAFTGSLVALTLTGLAKLPYLFLLPLLLCATAVAPRWRVLAVLAGAAPGIAWHVSVARLGLEWPGDP